MTPAGADRASVRDRDVGAGRRREHVQRGAAGQVPYAQHAVVVERHAEAAVCIESQQPPLPVPAQQRDLVADLDGLQQPPAAFEAGEARGDALTAPSEAGQPVVQQVRQLTRVPLEPLALEAQHAQQRTRTLAQRVVAARRIKAASRVIIICGPNACSAATP